MDTTLTVPPKETFRLSMLIYDTRYRSLTIQCVALMGFMLAAAWLVNNTLENLATLGKPIDFGFFSEPASYDISQRLIDYDSRDTHLRAAFVGVLNTLLVAVLGCILATVIGVFVGVMRLSKNWLISRLMAVYVEMFRNVPVLLWIVLALAIFIETLPKPGNFKGANATASMSLGDTVAVTNQGIFIPRLVNTPLAIVIWVVVIASIAGLIYMRRRATRIQNDTGVRPKLLWPGLGVLIVPTLVAYIVTSMITTSQQQTFIFGGDAAVASFDEAQTATKRFDLCLPLGNAAANSARIYLEEQEANFRRKNYFNPAAAEEAFMLGRCNLLTVPASRADSRLAKLQEAGTTFAQLSPLSAVEFSQGRVIEAEFPYMAPKGLPRFEGGITLLNSLLALWLALSLYTAAFIAEIVRAGIMAISKGQTEAASALGLRPNRTMSLVILPQALRVIIPPLISNYLNLTKNSSLAIAVGYMDMTGTLGGITLNQTGREMECLLLLMAIYLTISLSISAVMNWYNNSVKLVER